MADSMKLNAKDEKLLTDVGISLGLMALAGSVRKRPLEEREQIVALFRKFAQLPPAPSPTTEGT
jgi:hypothetical protein